MKKAVIDVFGDGEGNVVLDTDQVSTLYDDYNIIGDYAGRLSIQDVETMAEKLKECEALDMAHTDCMIAALNAVGIEVE